MIKVECAFDEMVPLASLVPNPANPNKHPVRQIKLLATIIESQGWRQAITVSRRSGFIVRGHGRYLAAVNLRLESVPVDFQEYESEAMEWADLIADNRIAELAEMDAAELASMLEKIDSFEIDLSLTGFTAQEFERIIEKNNREIAGGPEIEFTPEVMLEHNYIVLYYDNVLDWNVAVERFGLKTVKDLIPRKDHPVGIGRVLAGKDWLDRIKAE